jgi:hypothetical protein
MKRTWPILLIGALLLVVIGSAPANGADAFIDMEEDEFYISVNPDDPDMGYLEITGTVEGNLPNILDQLEVALSVNITEEYDGEPTGRYWACSVEFDDETVTPQETRLTFNQDSADFTIYIDPLIVDDQTGDIAVPEGITPLTVGKLELILTYTGTDEGQDIETATITPDYYHLVKLPPPPNPFVLSAGNRLNYTFRVINAGNEIDTVNIEIPRLQAFIDDGWTANLNITRVQDMEPGQKQKATLFMQAPNEILADRNEDLKILIYTDMINPDTEEPESSDELTIELQLKKSKVSDPVITDDDDDDDDVIIDDDVTTDPNTSPYAAVGVITVMAIIAVIVIIVLFIKRGGGDDEDGDEDMHASMVRI